MEKVYRAALERAVSAGDDQTKIVDGLLAHLAQTGRMKLLPRILRELRAGEERQAKLRPILEVAKESERASATKDATQLGITPQSVAVNPALISGFRVRSAATVLDRSGKQALIDIYKHIVTT